jgi:sterol 3beta-glucosyltransferase
MRLTILTAGTRGDTQPYIALGVALKQQRFTVRIATFEAYRSLVESYQLDFVPIKGDISQVASSEIGKKGMQADNPLKVFLSFNKMRSLVLQLQKDFYNACLDSDGIIYHPGAPIGYFYAQQQKIPGILAIPFPMVPTHEYPAVIFYNAPRLGKWFNFFSHKILEKIMWSAAGPAVKQFWQTEFDCVPPDFGCPYGSQNTQKYPTVISCSNAVFPRPMEWSAHIHQSGYWFLDDTADWKVPNDLQEFLSTGKPPVYIGFGSLGDPAAAQRTTLLAVKALAESGQRGILATGWSGMKRIDNLSRDFFILESAPHSWLFPRMAAVVHHGGAGTTAEGFRAGIPSIIVPFSNDQFAWGQKAFKLGVGPKPIPRKKLTAEALSNAIDLALTDKIRNAARDLGTKIRLEKGAQDSAKAILDCWK